MINIKHTFVGKSSRIEFVLPLFLSIVFFAPISFAQFAEGPTGITIPDSCTDIDSWCPNSANCTDHDMSVDGNPLTITGGGGIGQCHCVLGTSGSDSLQIDNPPNAVDIYVCFNAGIDVNSLINGTSPSDITWHINGGAGDDALSGSNNNDFIDGAAGDDVINGGNGDDQITGGDDNDEIYGGDGNDFLEGNDGSDTIDGQAGDDVVLGGPGNDGDVSNCDHNQTVPPAGLFGGPGTDSVQGGDGDDCIFLGDGNENFYNNVQGNQGGGYGGAGNDVIYGGSGNDTVDGQSGNDIVNGGPGNDLVGGGTGNDHVNGNEGVDTVNGSGGTDECVDMGDGDPDYSSEGFGGCEQFTYASIDKVRLKDQNGSMLLEWSTASEASTLGFKVIGYDALNRAHLITEFVPAIPNGGGGSDYQIHLTDRYERIDIQEIGQNNFGNRFSLKVQELQQNNRATKVYQSSSISSARLQPVKHERVIDALDNLSPIHEAIVEVSNEGWISISPSTLAPIMGYSIEEIQRAAVEGNLRITLNGESVAYRAIPSTGIEFYARKPSSLYQNYDAYRVELQEGRKLVDGEWFELSATNTIATMSVNEKFEVNNFAGTAIANSANQDYWYWAAIARSASVPDFETELTLTQDPTSSVALNILLRGASVALHTRHQVDAYVDGVLLKTLTFSEKESGILEFDVPRELIHDKKVHLSLRMSTSASAQSVVYIDRIKANFSSAENLAADVVHGTDGHHTLSVTEGVAGRIVSASGNYFEIGADSTQRSIQLSESFVWLPLKKSIAQFRVRPRRVVNISNSVEHLVVTKRALAIEANQLAAHRSRSGFRSQVVYFDDIADTFGASQNDPRVIHRLIRELSESLKYVVLFGSGNFDYKNHYGLGAGHLPPMMISSSDGGIVVSDQLLGDTDGDLEMDVAIGRIPVETKDEAQTYITSLIEYEENLASRSYGPIELLADAHRDSISDFDRDIDAFSSQVNVDIDVEQMSVDSVSSPEELSDMLQEMLQENPRAFVYAGHGGIDRITKSGWLSPELMTELRSQMSSPLPFASLMTCHAGSFAHPRVRGFAEAHMLGENPFALAWISAGAATIDVDNRILGQAIMREAGSNLGNARIGDLMRSALASTIERDEELRHNHLAYNLLGDPAMLLPRRHAGNTLNAYEAREIPSAGVRVDSLLSEHSVVTNTNTFGNFDEKLHTSTMSQGVDRGCATSSSSPFLTLFGFALILWRRNAWQNQNESIKHFK